MDESLFDNTDPSLDDPNPIGYYLDLSQSDSKVNQSRNTFEWRTSAYLKNVGECVRPDTFLERVVAELIRLAHEDSGQTVEPISIGK